MWTRTIKRLTISYNSHRLVCNFNHYLYLRQIHRLQSFFVRLNTFQWFGFNAWSGELHFPLTHKMSRLNEMTFKKCKRMRLKHKKMDIYVITVWMYDVKFVFDKKKTKKKMGNKNDLLIIKHMQIANPSGFSHNPRIWSVNVCQFKFTS